MNRKKLLGSYYWFIVTEEHSIWQEVAEKFKQMGNKEKLSQTTIKYKGADVVGFFIGLGFPIFEWLVNNCDLEKFEAYHSDWEDGFWEKSKLGRKKTKKTTAKKIRSGPVVRQLVKQGENSKGPWGKSVRHLAIREHIME